MSRARRFPLLLALVLAWPVFRLPAHAALIPVCGNGIVEPPETCDDGDVDPGDGCSAVCQLENVPPDCSTAAPSVTELWPPTHALVPISIGGVVDADGDDVTITVTGVSQDEPFVATGNGDACPDAEGVGEEETISLRAERKDQGDGRVYHVAFVAQDFEGATCTGEVQVCVPSEQAGGGCGDQGALVDSTGGPILCDGDACDAESCIPPAVPPGCEGAELPGGVERRLARASVLLERALIDEPSAKATRWRLHAARLMERAGKAAARAAAHGTLGDACGAALATQLGNAGTCARCIPEE